MPTIVLLPVSRTFTLNQSCKNLRPKNESTCQYYDNVSPEDGSTQPVHKMLHILNMPGGTEKTTENLSQDSHSPA
jgi:hypothetical protein